MPDLLFGPVPHQDAIDFLRSKAPVSRAVFDGLLPELRARAFCVSGIEDVNVLQRVRDKIAELPAGARWDDVKKDIASDISPFLVDPDADDEERDRQVTGATRRAELLLRTHGFQAYQSAAHDVAQRNRDTHPYLQYMTMEDDSVRPSHAALDGLILPADSPFWQDHTPPWDWGCRCQVVPISKDDYHDAERVDAKLPHDDRMILDDSRQRELETTGRLVRGPNRITNCASPVAMGTPHPFQWNPGDLRLPLDQLQARYAPDIWQTFQTWAEGTPLAMATPNATVWSWLQGLINPPSPAPVPPVRTSPVSAAMQVRLVGLGAGSLRGRVQRTLQVIDGTHDDGSLLPLRITKQVTARANAAEYRSPLHAWKKLRSGIGVQALPGAELAFTHEVGHALDELALAPGGAPKFGVFASEVSPELEEWRQAVEKTASYQTVKTKLAASVGTPSHDYYEYLHSHREAFARSYAQYVATKSGDQTLLDGLKHWGDALEQWTPADFAPMVEVFDRLFKARGWIA